MTALTTAPEEVEAPDTNLIVRRGISCFIQGKPLCIHSCKLTLKCIFAAEHSHTCRLIQLRKGNAANCSVRQNTHGHGDISLKAVAACDTEHIPNGNAASIHTHGCLIDVGLSQ